MAKGKYRRRNHQEPTQTNEVEQPKQQKKDTMLDDMARLDFENQMAHEQAGKEAPTYGFWGWLYRMQQKHGHNQLHKVNKKTYILLAVFTGWMGGHRFYEKRYKLAALYLLFFWTLIPLTMVVLDVMVAIPRQPDSQGMIEI